VINTIATRTLLDQYVFEILLPDLVGHDKRPSAFLVYVYLWWRASGSRTKRVAVSHQQVAMETGLSKSAVQAGIKVLVRRKLLQSHHASRTAVPEYVVLRPWVRRP
jgi:hypothetical protein